ncbi:MAG: hypothetical protein NTZ05_04140 [Chloroflexi bacterium]|nr:hypothetical protein [Chloroflexota bacterium]
MPVSGRVLYEVRREVSSNLDDLMLITAGVGTLPASLADTQPRPGAADEYKFSEVWAHTRSGRAWVTGSSYSGYIPTYTLSPAITGLAPGDPAELRQHIFKDRIDQTLLQAHDKLFGWAMVDATTTSLVGGAETSEYAVPSTWCALHTVEVGGLAGRWALL